MKAADIITSAPFGIIGINDKLQVFGGSDQKFTPADAGHVHEAEVMGEPTEADLMTGDEKVILADHMLARWQAYKQATMAEGQITPPGFQLGRDWMPSIVCKPRESGEYEVRLTPEPEAPIIRMKFDAINAMWMSGQPVPNDYAMLPALAEWRFIRPSPPPPAAHPAA